MRKTLLISLMTITATTVMVFANCGNCPGDKKAETVKITPRGAKAEKKECGNCPGHKKASGKKCGGKMCPENIEGVSAVSMNIPGGVEITMTAKDKETVARLQELALAHHNSTEEKCENCPKLIPGAEVKLENTADGVRTLITGKTPETVKKIQEAAAKGHKHEAHRADGKEAKTSKKFACPMKCAESEKPGKCPRCGMNMEEKK